MPTESERSIQGKTVKEETGPSRLEMTPRRQELFSWFKRNAPSLCKPYEAAVRLLDSPDFPARVHLMGHLVRDIANRLPDILEGTTSNRVEYASKMDSIARLWQKHFHPKADYSQVPASPDISAKGLPSKIFEKLDDLIADHRDSRERPNRQERLFLSGITPEVDSLEILRPQIKQFEKICEWFMGKTHLPNKVKDPTPEDELRRKFENFEQVILGIKGQFFTNIGELDEILQDTN